MSKLAVLLLAAGNSSRMGYPKQLLNWKNDTLLQHAINTVKKIHLKTILVLGANSETILSKIDANQVTVLVNDQWNQGLGSTIAYGVNYIKTMLPEIDNILIMLADQPLIDTAFFSRMIQVHKENPNKVVCTLYPNSKRGVPVIFNSTCFDDLVQLHDDMGAKHLLERYSNDVIAINGVDIVNDIDTPNDYDALYKLKH